MNADSELLHLAAKAAGFYVKSEVVNQDDEFIGLRVKPGVSAPRVTIAFWNPLTDDGDALRLAVKLDLMIYCASRCARPSDDSLSWFYGDQIEDDQTAIRRAIVRAAAEIGRTLA